MPLLQNPSFVSNISIDSLAEVLVELPSVLTAAIVVADMLLYALMFCPHR